MIFSVVGGTLTFFREEGTMRCLDVSSLPISKRSLEEATDKFNILEVHSDHHEVVADIVQTSFLFSVPMDGPMSFATPHVSVQWNLRFEFFATPRNIDWTRYEHPLLVDGRDICEWCLPVIVHSPQPGAATSHFKAWKNPSFEPLCLFGHVTEDSESLQQLEHGDRPAVLTYDLRGQCESKKGRPLFVVCQSKSPW